MLLLISFFSSSVRLELLSFTVSAISTFTPFSACLASSSVRIALIMSSVESTSPVSGTLSSTNTETLISVLTSELSEPGLLLSPGLLSLSPGLLSLSPGLLSLSPGLLSLSPGCVFSSLGITVMSALSPHTVQ